VWGGRTAAYQVSRKAGTTANFLDNGVETAFRNGASTVVGQSKTYPARARFCSTTDTATQKNLTRTLAKNQNWNVDAPKNESVGSERGRVTKTPAVASRWGRPFGRRVEAR